MPEFTIEQAAHKKDMPPKEGMRPSQVVALKLSDAENIHDAEWITSKETNPESLVGTRVSGTIEATPYGLRFKKDRPGFGGGGAGRPRDPKTESAIQRQHSQHMAVLLLQAKATAGVLAEGDLTPGKIKTLTDWFDDDIAAGVQRKHPTPGMVHGLPVRNEPVRTGAPDVAPEPYAEPAPADGTEPFAA